MSELQPFRIHFHDPDLLPLDIEAPCVADARKVAIERRNVTEGAIRKVKLIREKANG
ncbi:hypothetical protein [Ensifer sp. Root31]|uniref:hypothetical protein n=1 Tax=Ensifer sp. Root31 TaxID=1736512 RepID=UPI000AA819A9|nr:hypothetical protein [Ensifer sp. Root31]